MQPDLRTTEELVRAALAVQAAGNPDASDCVDDYARLLAQRPGEALVVARQLAVQPTARHQAVAAVMLARVVENHPDTEPVVLAELERLLPRAADAEVRAGIACAFGWAASPAAFPFLLQLANDADSDVRLYVAIGLSRYCGMHADGPALAALLALTQDADDDVRDWATFGIGTQLAIDTPQVRQALVERLQDPHADTRSEAIVGLAARADERCLAPLIEVLESGNVAANDIEAAAMLADPRLLPALLRVLDMMLDEDWDPWWAKSLDQAIARCARAAAYGPVAS